ncbi:Nuclease SbcCD subunit C [compost metagenome]
MLPQGEFRKLLTSETENKEEILRRIFRTELYQQVEGRFQQKTKDLKTELTAKQTELDVYVKQIVATLPIRDHSALAQTMLQEQRNVTQIVEGLDQEELYYKDQLVQSQQARVVLQADLSTKQHRLQEARAINERYQELGSKQLELVGLESRLAEYADKQERLRMAEQAARILPYEEQWNSAIAMEQRKSKELEQKKLDMQAASRIWESAEQSYQAESVREEERRLAERELQRLLDLVPSVESLYVNQQEVTALHAQDKQHTDVLAQQEKQLQQMRVGRAELSEQIKLLEQETAVVPERRERLNKLREQAKLMKDVIEQERLMSGYSKQELERRQLMDQMQSEHDGLEKQWIEGQSSFLAAHLHDGLPCPVCGSELHPHKAAAVLTLPTKEQLQETKDRLRRVEQEYLEMKSQVAATRIGLGDKHQALADYGIELKVIKEQYDQLVSEGKDLKEETDRLEQQLKKLQPCKEQSYQLEAEWDKLTLAKDQTNALHKDILIKLHAKQSMLDKDLERIPPELRTPSQLNQQIQQQKRTSDQLEQAWKLVQEQVKQAQSKLVEEKAYFAQMELQVEEAIAALKQAELRFQQELEMSGFSSITVYRDTKLVESVRKALQADIDGFANKRTLLAQQIAQLEQDLTGKERVDLEQMLAEQRDIEVELEKATIAYQEFKGRCNDVERLKNSILAISGQVRALEQNWQQVKDVYDVLRGDNPQKLSFERYVLIEFLEQILHAANERLRVLSNGQFVLQRSERLEKHNRQSGLGLDVYDAYTGLNRDVKSMSGGEKFNASLCLALGMTDVIQAHQGGIAIDMMFIDEGFGSLDEDALNKAIEALIDLQQTGRMIGVISHVQELKTAFPAVLEVRKTREGHSTTSLVVK